MGASLLLPPPAQPHNVPVLHRPSTPPLHPAPALYAALMSRPYCPAPRCPAPPADYQADGRPPMAPSALPIVSDMKVMSPKDYQWCAAATRLPSHHLKGSCCCAAAAATATAAAPAANYYLLCCLSRLLRLLPLPRLSSHCCCCRRYEYPTPRAMEKHEITEVIASFG